MERSYLAGTKARARADKLNVVVMEEEKQKVKPSFLARLDRCWCIHSSETEGELGSLKGVKTSTSCPGADAIPESRATELTGEEYGRVASTKGLTLEERGGPRTKPDCGPVLSSRAEEEDPTRQLPRTSQGQGESVGDGVLKPDKEKG